MRKVGEGGVSFIFWQNGTLFILLKVFVFVILEKFDDGVRETGIHPLSTFWLVPNWPISRLILPGPALIMLNLLKHNFWRKGNKNMIFPVTILYLRCSFLLTASLKKNWIHRISIRSNWKTPYFNGSGWRAGIICPTKEKQPMGAKKGTTMGGTWPIQSHF